VTRKEPHSAGQIASTHRPVIRHDRSLIEYCHLCNRSAPFRTHGTPLPDPGIGTPLRRQLARQGSMLVRRLDRLSVPQRRSHDGQFMRNGSPDRGLSADRRNTRPALVDTSPPALRLREMVDLLARKGTPPPRSGKRSGTSLAPVFVHAVGGYASAFRGPSAGRRSMPFVVRTRTATDEADSPGAWLIQPKVRTPTRSSASAARKNNSHVALTHLNV